MQIGSVLNGTGGTVQVTFVTFLENGTSSTIGFCADQTSLFPHEPNRDGQFQSWTTLRDRHHRYDCWLRWVPRPCLAVLARQGGSLTFDRVKDVKVPTLPQKAREGWGTIIEFVPIPGTMFIRHRHIVVCLLRSGHAVGTKAISAGARPALRNI